MLRRPTPPPGPLDRVLRLPDARLLGYAEFGDPLGAPVVVFHANPGSRLSARPLSDAASERGLRLIALERPGFGLSDDHPGRTLETWTDDVLEAARHLGVERFAILALGAGVPYALAFAGAQPARLTALALAGKPSDEAAPGRLAWLRFELLRLAATRFPELAIRQLRKQATPESRAALDEPLIRAVVIADLREAFRHGPSGAVHDARLLVRSRLPQGESPPTGIPVLRWPEADGLPWLVMHAASLLDELAGALR